MQATSATDAELVEASRLGDRAAFGELVVRCARLVGAVSYAATRDRSLSEDITQDAFTTAWRDLDRLRDATAVRPWLCSIARNLALKARRERRRERIRTEPDTLPGGPTPFDVVHQRELEDTVATALARVPDVYREALVLFYYEQRSAKQVAAALGITEDVVHKRVSRGRQYLASGIDPMIEHHVRRRRSRREVAACVLAALALVPAHVFAASRGARMMKLAVAGLVATTLVAATFTGAGAKDRPARRQVTVPRAAPPPRAPAAPRLPLPPTCEAAVRHIVDLSIADFDISVKDHVAGIRRTTAELEQQCRDEWTADQRTCMLAKTAAKQVETCLPRPKPTRPVLPVLGADQPCDALGAHVADLMLAHMRGVRQDNVAAAIIEEPDELTSGVQDECVDEQWTDDQRRCFAAATAFDQIILCRQSY